MVFDPLGVDLGGFGADADRGEEREDDFVAFADAACEFAAGVGQEDGAAGLGGDKAVTLQAGDGADDGDMGDAEALGEVGDAGFAAGFDEVGDGFDVVLGGGGGAGAAGPDVIVGLACSGGASGFRGFPSRFRGWSGGGSRRRFGRWRRAGHIPDYSREGAGEPPRDALDGP